MREADALLAEITRESETSASTTVIALSDAIRARGEVAATLYYGSGLWKESTPDTIHDFYTLVDGFRHFDKRRLSACLGWFLPPNVYYLETIVNGETLRAKVAVLTRKQFLRMASGRSLSPQIWARFAQPCRLVFAKDAAVGTETLQSLYNAVLTFHSHSLPLVPKDATPEVVWQRGLADTYAAELRPERPERTADLIAANSKAFAERTWLARTILTTAPQWPPFWPPISVLKFLTFLRLVKAVFTFEGGVDYALWKIARQSGVKLEATERQKRHPLLFSWPLVWRLYRRGGFR